MKTLTLLLMCILTVVLCTNTQSRIIYVDDNATGANDGSSWQNAYIYLQDALTDANSSENHAMSLSNGPVEIRVAQGTYKPNQGLISIDHPSIASFSLINNVTIKGGYAGVNESYPNSRDIELYESILSGDLDDDDIEVEDPCDLLRGIRGINSDNVLFSNENDASSVLDGFTIKGGRFFGSADPGPYGGGGMFIRKGNPTIISCTFTGNAVYEYGGAIFINYGSPTLIGCTFTKNYASIGGAIFNGNSGFERRTGNPTFKNCVFSNNYSTTTGAGISGGGNILMSNCTFTGNLSESSGAGLSNYGNVKLENCTFNGNWAKQNSSIAQYSSSILNISNCIIWDGQDSISDSNFSTLTVSYSDIQGGLEGEGNINADPLFTNPGYWADANDPNNVVEPNAPNAVWVEGDYHLKSQAGRFDPNSQTWIQDDVTSPCIDAGDPNSPIGYEPFPNGGRINMGAYGGTTEASKSYFGKPVCETIVAGDINGDCKVDELDLKILMLHWLEDNNK
jgi:hypothetical protein